MMYTFGFSARESSYCLVKRLAYKFVYTLQDHKYAVRYNAHHLELELNSN
jgi:hypothetical protein